MKKIFSFLKETINTVLIAVLIVVPIRMFIFQPFLVQGASMEPTYHQNDYLIVDQLSYRFREPERGEVIILDSPQASGRRFIKRVIGLPGETVTIIDGKVHVENEERFTLSENYTRGEAAGRVEVDLSENEYFVLGDNREASRDSRQWGPLKESDIVGRVILQFPPRSVFAD